MKCFECLADLGEFDQLLPIYRLRLSGYGVNQTEGVQIDGYVHLWHVTSPETR